jgi:predicted nucleic-acid-binding Zn-ribbon protein
MKAFHTGYKNLTSTGKCPKCGCSTYKELVHRCPLKSVFKILKEEDLLKCPKCGKKMKNVKDQITGKKSKYLFGCKCNPNTILSKG